MSLTDKQVEQLKAQVMHTCCQCTEQTPPLPCCNRGHVDGLHGATAHGGPLPAPDPCPDEWDTDED